MKTNLFFKTTALVLLLIGFSAFSTNFKTKKLEDSHLENKQFIKVALLLDTSNSMDGLIDQAKAQLWEIVNELSYAKCKGEQPNLRIALYEYGNDQLSASEGYMHQVIGFSNDLDDISKALFSLTTNGGNEFCGQVIQTSLNQLDWGQNADDLKLIFIAGSEPFTQGKINYKDAATNANKKNVIINTIFCGDYHQGISSFWKDGADLTHGEYLSINHNKATVFIASPYDDAILILNKKLNKTYVSYGLLGKTKLAIQEVQDGEAINYSKANAVSRTVSKSSHLYKNSKWDLVDALEMDESIVEELEVAELPEALKGKSSTAIKAFIKAKSTERKHIKNEIQELNKKRRVYILKQQKNNSNGLESAVVDAIKKQAKKKNYIWD